MNSYTHTHTHSHGFTDKFCEKGFFLLKEDKKEIFDGK